MRKWKQEWKEKMKKIKKERIRWEQESDQGRKFKGEYGGEIIKGKPNGIGTWKRDRDHSTVEGERKDGKLNGKAVFNALDGNHV